MTAVPKAGKALYPALLHLDKLALLLRACRLYADQIFGKRQALPAFGLATQPCIDVCRFFVAATHGGAQVFFADGIADTDDHENRLSVNAN